MKTDGPFVMPMHNKKPEDRAEAPESTHGDAARTKEQCFGHKVYYTPSWHNLRGRVKPYGKDVETKLRELICGAFDKAENTDINMVCT